MTESFNTADGRTLTYRREGEGPVLVCHPGGPGFSSTYFADFGGLGQSFTLVLFNPRGTAGSDRPERYALGGYVADLEELRMHLGLEEMNLLGHSHGGLVAIAYASEYPARLRRLVLSCTAACFHEPQQSAIGEAKNKRSDEPWYDDANAAFKEEEAGDFANDEELAELVVRGMAFYFARYDDAAREFVRDYVAAELPNPDALSYFNDNEFTTLDLRPNLERIDAPTLVLTGAEDFICGPVCAADLSGGIAGAETLVLDECGHFPYFEQRDRFREGVTRFLT
jgi:proline-specific peptidase